MMAKKMDCGCGCVPPGKTVKRKVKTEKAKAPKKRKENFLPGKGPFRGEPSFRPLRLPPVSYTFVPKKLRTGNQQRFPRPGVTGSPTGFPTTPSRSLIPMNGVITPYESVSFEFTKMLI